VTNYAILSIIKNYEWQKVFLPWKKKRFLPPFGKNLLALVIGSASEWIIAK